MESSLADEIIFGTRESVAALLEAGVGGINEMDEYGYIPLIEAAIVDKVDIAELLLEKGARVNLQDTTGQTALHWAVDNSNPAFCKLLLENKADPNAYTLSGQPALTYAVLRNDQPIKQLMYQYKADVKFAQDFINTKLIGHRYELAGQTDIVTAQGSFIEIDFEGFYFEFTVALILNSLKRYVKNFQARHLRGYFEILEKLIDTLEVGSELLRYQHQTINLKEHKARIDALLGTDLLLIPTGFRGHAISLVKYGNLLARVDRGEIGRKQGTVIIYHIGRPDVFNTAFAKELIYTVQDKSLIEYGLHEILELTPITTLPISPQVSGNCSWANVEATIPTMMLLLALPYEPTINKSTIEKLKTLAMDLYLQWSEWDKDRALDECIESFHHGSPARNASKAAILGAVLFQKCKADQPKDLERAQKILSVLTMNDYIYVLKSYVDAFCMGDVPPLGENLLKIFKYFDVDLKALREMKL